MKLVSFLRDCSILAVGPPEAVGYYRGTPLRADNFER